GPPGTPLPRRSASRAPSLLLSCRYDASSGRPLGETTTQGVHAGRTNSGNHRRHAVAPTLAVPCARRLERRLVRDTRTPWRHRLEVLHHRDVAAVRRSSGG